VPLTEFGATRELYFGGDLEAAIALTGQVAGRIEDVRSAADIVHGTVREFREVLAGLARWA
jgi:enoyl-[acyl-carrier protein] reductase II